MHRNGLRVLVAVTSLFAFVISASAGKATDAAAIQNVFSQYKEALLASDGSRAADLVSSRTIVYYEEILGLALNTPKRKLADLDFISKFMVLRIRHEFDKTTLAKMTGRELLILGVKRGWISKSSVSNIGELTHIKVRDDQASASIPVAPGLPAFYFHNESGQWKLDLLSSFELGNAAMKQEIAKSGLTEEQFILRALAMLSPKNVDERILSGPLD